MRTQCDAIMRSVGGAQNNEEPGYPGSSLREPRCEPDYFGLREDSPEASVISAIREPFGPAQLFLVSG